jgi:hypothetical protein
MKKFVLVLALALMALVLSCSGGGGGGDDGPDYNYLNNHNANRLNGHTIRWPSTTIYVNASGVPGAQAAFNRWAGSVNFAFTGGSANIIVRMGNPGAGRCGVTLTRWYTSGRIFQALIIINPDQSRCRSGLAATITHEAAHAIGYFGHEDGIMGPTSNGDTEITGKHRGFLSLLYSMAPGTNIAGFLRRKDGSAVSGVAFDPNGRRLIETKHYSR